MCEFPGVTFHPWIGEHYGREESCFKVRLLVLGESHYDSNPEFADCDFTRQVVRKWGQKRRYSFFTKIANVLRGRAGWISDDERREIWEHTAFYNFVQSVVPDSRMPPTFRQWCEAQTPFETVLQGLDPDAVLMLGKRLSEHVLLRPQNVTFEMITHPSSSQFRHKDAIPTFKKLLCDTRQRIAQE